MKYISSQITYLFTQQETRRNLVALFKVLSFLAATVVVYSALFHLMMLREGQQHSLLTGLYWTLTVMSTLGFGDITFQSDLGRAFSILVLLSGIVLLLIVLPFAFIRFFYAPWLEAQLRLRAPRQVPADLSDHVILCHYDDIAKGLIDRLDDQGIPYCVIEPDPARAAELKADGVRVVSRDVDGSATYQAVRAHAARLVVANLSDAVNTNITLTVREQAGDVHIAALAEDKDSIDVLDLSGANHVLDLKHRLGQHLATRVTAGTAHSHRVGRFKDLVIAEFPVHNTPLAGRRVGESHLRRLTGLNIVAYSERGRLLPVRADTVLSDYSVAVVVGTEAQVDSLDALFVIYEPNENPVLVIGGGKVGRAVARALREREVSVNIVERDPAIREVLREIADQVFTGDAADFDVLMEAGLASAPTVVLTTNDDATNIFLAVYCRRLNQHARIVSRITHERNLEAIHRAGAEFVLSYGTLGVTSLLSLVHGRELVLVGEGVDLFVEPVPARLAGRTLGETDLGARTGLNVIAVQKPDGPAVNPVGETGLEDGQELVMLGTPEQLAEFRKTFV
ncbi:MAG: NAD-binding protein [Myxococcota bacterium]|nr:NAD-binding protein [Myxococcota bacterium]